MARQRSESKGIFKIEGDDTQLVDLTEIRDARSTADDPGRAAPTASRRHGPGREAAGEAAAPGRREALDWSAARRVAARTTPTRLDRGLAEEETAAPQSQAQWRLRDFILATSDWVWETDDSGLLVFVSDRIAEVIGRPAADLRGSYLLDLGQSPEAAGGETLLDALKARRPFRGRDFEILGADHQPRRCALSGVPVFDEDSGRFAGYRGTGTDITARHEAEQTARGYRQKLEHALEEIRNKNMYLELALNDSQAATRAKDEFLAIVSHELRTPLNAIIGFTDIMRREMFGPIGNERYSEYLKNVSESADHLLAIIADILDMSKIESGALTIEDGEVDIAATVEAAWKLMADRAREQRVEFATILPAGLPPLRADERILRQMLINLFSNGIKFTPDGGTITVGAGVQPDGSLSIRVSDTGIGIDEADFETVLAPFGQVEDAYNRVREGTGLGLPLVKSMTEMHDGHLELQSELGVGTTVTLVFPSERVVRRGNEA